MRAAWAKTREQLRSLTTPDLGSLRIDLPLLLAALVLVALGVVMVHSAGAPLSLRRHGDPYYFMERQALHSGLGLLALCLALLVDVRVWQRFAGTIFIAAFGLLLAVLIIPGAGESAGGATRWLRIGPLSFQPSELGKLALLLFLSRMLANRHERIASLLGGYIPTLAFTGVIAVPVLLQPDFGSAVTISTVAMAMLLFAGARLRHIGATILGALPVVYWLIDSAPYRRARMLAFLDPFAHRREEGYQIYESLVSFAAGGFSGVGLGEGPQKHGYLPEYHNDFILAAVGEELGLLGVVVVIGCFAVIVWRGLRIARQLCDRALANLAFGITLLLGVQAIIHMGVVMALLPTKGINLPFVSYGGTSLIVSLFLVGLLLHLGLLVRPPAQREGR